MPIIPDEDQKEKDPNAGSFSVFDQSASPSPQEQAPAYSDSAPTIVPQKLATAAPTIVPPKDSSTPVSTITTPIRDNYVPLIKKEASDNAAFKPISYSDSVPAVSYDQANNPFQKDSPVTAQATVDKSPVQNIVSFLAGGEMAMLGMKWDREGFEWSLEAAKDEWHEHPLMSAFTLATDAAMLIPPVGAALKIGRWSPEAIKYSTEIGGKGVAAARAVELADEIKQGIVPVETVQAGFKNKALAAVTQSPLNEGRPYFDVIREMATDGNVRTAEAQVFKDTGRIDSVGDLIRRYNPESKVAQMFEEHGDAALGKLSPEEIEDALGAVPEDVMGKLRMHVNQYQSNVRLKAKQLLAEDPTTGISLTKGEAFKIGFNNWFGNRYWDEVNKFIPSDIIQNTGFKYVESFVKPELFQKLAQNPPPASEGPAIYHHILYDLAQQTGVPHEVPDLPPALSERGAEFLKAFYAHSEPLQDGGLRSGFLTEQERFANPIHAYLGYQRAGLASDVAMTERASAVIRKTTDVGEEFMVNSSFRPNLNNYATRIRKGTLADAYKRLQTGKLMDTPDELFLYSAVNDRMVLEKYLTVRDAISDTKYITNSEALAQRYGEDKVYHRATTELGGYVNLENILDSDAKERLVRMINKKQDIVHADILGDGLNRLPWVRKEVYHELFGDKGLEAQTRWATGWLEALTTVAKTAKTILNPTTQMQNGLGNFVFLHQAGLDPLAAGSIRAAKDIIDGLNGYSKALTATKALGATAEDVRTPLSEWLNANKDRMITYENNGRTFSTKFTDLIGLTGEGDGPRLMKEILAENTFDFTDGWTHLQNLYSRLPDSNFSAKKFVKIMLDLHSPPSIASKADEELNVAQKLYKNIVTGSFDGATKLYVQADMVPKFLLYLHNRADGLSQAAAITEVARRLPMYKTVGSKVHAARRVILPWITFTTEAARITKNNMMDHPLRVLPWLMAPRIMQASAFGLGLLPEGETYDTIEASKANAPDWLKAKGPTEMVMFGGPRGLAAAGAATGAVSGGIAGSYLGGPVGALAGGLAGGALGAWASWALDDTHNDHLRGLTLNWLPHSNVMLQGLRSPDLDFSISGFEKMADSTGLQPATVIMPFIHAFQGQDMFGNDIKDDGTVYGKVNKTVASFMAAIAPPWLQRYGTKVSSPDVPVFANDWTDGLAGAAFAAATGLAIKASPLSTAAAAGAGFLIGSAANIQRLYVDTGQAKGPDNEYGSFGQDFLFNNMGVVKSYRITPTTALQADARDKKNYANSRAAIMKDYTFAAQTTKEDGDKWDQMSKDSLKKIAATFNKEYENPVEAQRAYTDFLKRNVEPLATHPYIATKGMTAQDILDKLNITSQVAEEARGSQWNAMRQLLYQGRSQQLVGQYLKERKQREEKGFLPTIKNPALPSLKVPKLINTKSPRLLP